MVIVEVPGLPLGTLRPLAPVVGLASLAVAGTAFWRNGSVAVTPVARAFAIGIAYLNTSMRPRLAPLVSPSPVARLVRATGRTDDVAVSRLHRAWPFGLSDYLNRDLPAWDERPFLSPPRVVTNSQGILALEAQDVPGEILDDVSAEGVLVTLRPPPQARRRVDPLTASTMAALVDPGSSSRPSMRPTGGGQSWSAVSGAAEIWRLVPVSPLPHRHSPL